MRKLLLIIAMLVSMECSGQSFPFGYNSGLRLGCGNDLDLTFTGSMFIAVGSGAFVYGYQRINYIYQTTDKQYNNIQNIGIGLLIAGGVILLEESIRHSVHKKSGGGRIW
jgi:hypothetical protein